MLSLLAIPKFLPKPIVTPSPEQIAKACTYLRSRAGALFPARKALLKRYYL